MRGRDAGKIFSICETNPYALLRVCYASCYGCKVLERIEDPPKEPLVKRCNALGQAFSGWGRVKRCNYMADTLLPITLFQQKDKLIEGLRPETEGVTWA